jgi:hypothetical protein
MTTQSQNKLSYEEVDNRVAAFDEWLAGQEQPVKDTVFQHIGALIKAVPTMGEKSAKLLLAEVYLVARRHIHIEKKYGGREK